MNPDQNLKVHILFESQDQRTPNGSSYIRLIRPLTHPMLDQKVTVSYGSAMISDPVDVVVIDRLWRDDISLEMQSELLNQLKSRSIPYIYSIDDNLLELGMVPGRPAFPSPLQRNLIRRFAREAAGVIVSTEMLATQMRSLNKNVEVLPNQLDESLEWGAPRKHDSTESATITLGYMGTYSHLDDLIMISWPLRRLLASHSGTVELEIVGIANAAEIRNLFADLPVKVLTVPADCIEYPNFVRWMSTELAWDFAVAPLQDNKFNASKSDIKWLDYGMLGIPGIFSNVPSYQSTIVDGQDGLLVDNSLATWEAALNQLTSDTAARRKMGVAAHKRISSERTLASHAQKWLAAISKFTPPQVARIEAPAVIKAASNRPASTSDRPLNPKGLQTRQEKLLHRANLDGIGLEIGASFAPLLPKSSGYNIETLDHATQEELVAKYSGGDVDVSRIEPVDHVWKGEPLDELIGATNRYDYIVASHVIEHTPNMISFLSQCENLLKPNGVLALAIPDKRYCFDILRPTSTSGDVLQANVEGRSRHTAGAVFDHFSTIAFLNEEPSWSKGADGSLKLLHSHAEAVELYQTAIENDDYIDIHCWRFTPASFRLIMNDILSLGLTRLQEISQVEPHGMEFYSLLEKPASPEASIKNIAKDETRLKLAIAARNDWVS